MQQIAFVFVLGWACLLQLGSAQDEFLAVSSSRLPPSSQSAREEENGPIEAAEAAALLVLGTVEGYLDSFVSDPSILTECFKEAETIDGDVEGAISKLMSPDPYDIAVGILELSAILNEELEAFSAVCGSIAWSEDDKARAAGLSDLLKKPLTLVKAVLVNYQGKAVEIYELANSANEERKAGKWLEAGKDLGGIFGTLLEPPASSDQHFQSPLQQRVYGEEGKNEGSLVAGDMQKPFLLPTDVSAFVLGWVEGYTSTFAADAGIFTDCFQMSETANDKVEAALLKIISANATAVAEGIQDLVLAIVEDFAKAASSCVQVSWSDADKAKAFNLLVSISIPPIAFLNVLENFQKHGQEITAKLQEYVKFLMTAEFLKAGKALGTASELLIDPHTDSENTEEAEEETERARVHVEAERMTAITA
uniref:Uncharacterized protein n=1 Tax=Chromera velia CCMP2878 TaxID=1169474 RepID=A0A0G4IF93_9ALVE|eukprot:Cvel_2432.t1-p1 / transcript=Cvel_2432.t1 / gene=Cvel_2432 / organism=Chromera_velia_CCMP2878 / gene_product=hypothetical protein / transcript_product=hypothetical protein / location=Cvel_scaffold95:75023-78637(-) / protein_length=421 / sequence_SO=supercontig / SO=protein_coding / is_pseudo=false